MRKEDDLHRGSPYSAPQISKQVQPPKTLSLSNSQVVIILGLIAMLFIWSFYRLTQQRVFDINNITMNRQRGLCRVSFNAINRNPNSVSGKAIIEIFEDGVPSAYTNIYLAATSSVPISLASGQAKMVRVDIAHSGLCNHIEVTAVGSQG